VPDTQPTTSLSRLWTIWVTGVNDGAERTEHAVADEEMAAGSGRYTAVCGSVVHAASLAAEPGWRVCAMRDGFGSQQATSSTARAGSWQAQLVQAPGEVALWLIGHGVEVITHAASKYGLRPPRIMESSLTRLFVTMV
jgi:hypothetical protein